MNAALKKKLKAAKKAYSAAKERAVAESGFSEIEDGRYIAQCVGAEVTESQSSGRLQINWTWRICEGEFQNEQTMDFDGLETEDNLMWTCRKLARFGYDAPDDIEDIVAIVEEIAEDQPFGRIRLKTKGDFQNLFLDKTLAEYDPPDDYGGETADDEPDDEDDIDEDEDEDEEYEDEEDDEDEDEEEYEDDDEDEDLDEDEDDEEDLDEDDDEDEDDEEIDVEPGMRVAWMYRNAERLGTVSEIKDNGILVKPDGKSRRSLVEWGKFDILLDDDADEPEEEPDWTRPIDVRAPIPEKPKAKPKAKAKAKPKAAPKTKAKAKAKKALKKARSAKKRK